MGDFFVYLTFLLYLCMRFTILMYNTVIKRIVLALVCLFVSIYMSAQETYLYAQRDTCALYLDIHRPAAGTQTDFQGVQKPAILYIFGGGFKSGARNEGYLLKWFRVLNDNGYAVVSIDYRLGMKGYKMGKGLAGVAKSVKQFKASQQIGVEDAFAAISFLEAHPELGIDVNNIVLSGNSAGAIISLACAHEIANGHTEGLPEHFAPKGVISFAGGIISLNGAPSFDNPPCPILFFHGEEDNAVAYKHVNAFGRGIWGSSYLAEKMKKKGYNYSIYRFKNRAHEVAAYMDRLWPEEQAFLEKNVMQSIPCIVDATVDNPSLPVWSSWGSLTPQKMYNGDL